MAKILSLQLVNNGGLFQINDIDIVKVYADTLGSAVRWVESDSGLPRTAVVTASLANISTFTDVLISVTMSDNSVQYLIINRVVDMYEDPTSGYAVIYYDQAGAALERLMTSESVPAITAKLSTKNGDTSYVFDSVNFTTGVIALAAAEGDKTSVFTNGIVFNVVGTNWSNVFSVSSSTYNATLGITYITVNETISRSTEESGRIVTQG
jgi:hypothetical protein